MTSPIFLKNVNKELKSVEFLFPILVQQKNGFYEIVLKLTKKFRNVIFVAIARKKILDFFLGPEIFFKEEF